MASDGKRWQDPTNMFMFIGFYCIDCRSCNLQLVQNEPSLVSPVEFLDFRSHHDQT